MKKLLVIGLLVFASTSAFAQKRGGAPRAAAAPASPSSHQMNLRFNPIGLAIGVFNFNFDYAIHPEWTVGPEVAYMNRTVGKESALIEDITIKGFQIGVRANWHRNGVFNDGLYVGPSLHYASVTASTSDAAGKVEGTANAILASGLVGYGWFWDSFNILLGGGITVPLGNAQVEVKDSAGTTVKSNISSGAALEFSLGWAF